MNKSAPETSTTPLYRAQGISKSFAIGGDTVTILDALDLDIAAGETIAIVGASGVGKTTLLNILGTLERPTAGAVLYQGEEVFARREKALCRFRNRTIGFVFQFHHLLPEFTALENIMIPGLIAGRPRQEMEERAAALLEQIGLAARGRHQTGELSGGEQQRVAIARALVMRPAILLADEPTGNLDPRTGSQVFDLIAELNTRLSLATVIVTHNHELARRMDRCLVLRDGKLHPWLETVVDAP